MKVLLLAVGLHLMEHKKRLQAECDHLKQRPGNSALVGRYETLIDNISKDMRDLDGVSYVSGPMHDVLQLMHSRPDLEHIVVTVSAKGYLSENPDEFQLVATHEYKQETKVAH